MMAEVPAEHDSTYLGSRLVRGNLTRVTRKVLDGVTADIEQRLFRDIFGNVVRADVDCCNTKSWEYTAATLYSMPSRAIDGVENTAPFHVTTYDYEFDRGLLQGMTDPRGHYTDYGYDAAYRLTSVVLPTGATSSTVYDDSALTVKQVTTYQDGASQRKVTGMQWLDGRGQPLRSGEGAGETPTAFDATAVVYDQLGRVLRSSHPYQAGSNGTGTPANWTTFSRAS